jgi:hypothetical protein
MTKPAPSPFSRDSAESNDEREKGSPADYMYQRKHYRGQGKNNLETWFTVNWDSSICSYRSPSPCYLLKSFNIRCTLTRTVSRHSEFHRTSCESTRVLYTCMSECTESPWS